MIVVRHQAIGVAEPVESFSSLSEYLEELLAIGVVEEDALICVTTGCDVVHHPFVFDPQRLLDDLTTTIASLKKKEQKCITQAKKLIAKEEVAAQSFQILQTVPGVGPVTAIALLTLFRRHLNTNRKQIVALAGRCGRKVEPPEVLSLGSESGRITSTER